MNCIFAVVLAVRACSPGRLLDARYSADLLRTPIDAPYQLASGDRLRVIVFGQDNLVQFLFGRWRRQSSRCR